MDFPKAWKRFWNDWDLRAFVLASLFLQVILIFSGGRRMRVTCRWVSFILWSSYLLADWVATFALGILATSQSDPDCSSVNSNSELLAFWSPFLLLHMGGPDTITAFSLEDNELWMRHFVAFLFHVAVAMYAFLRSLPGTRLSAPGFLMFVAGILKYGERTWALMSASMENLRNSMVTPPDPGPDYAKFMEEYASISAAGLQPRVELVEEPETQIFFLDTRVEPIEYEMILSRARHFFRVFKRLIVDLILTVRDRKESQSFFMNLLPVQAFRVIEIELAFIYEILYTKSIVIHTVLGPFFRLVTTSSIVASLVLFLLTEKNGYQDIDIGITLVLVIGALVLEVHAVCLLIFSDCAFLKLKHLKLSRIIYKVICLLRPPNKPRWANSIAQHNLISFCLKDKPSRVKKIISCTLNDIWDKFRYTKAAPVSDELKELIFKEVMIKLRSIQDSGDYKRFRSYRGEWALEKKGYYEELSWTIEVDFDESILLWHIATDLCYYSDDSGSIHNLPSCRMSKSMSDYMLYLLVVQPFMMTSGIGQIRYGDTCAEAKNFFQRGRCRLTENKACEMLLKVETTVLPREVKGDGSKSVMFDACRLSKELLKLRAEKRWEVISVVWVEMLCYAASQCRGYYHAKMLSAGGELLTLVWFLMAHLGLGEQYRVEAGHARAKLIIGNKVVSD